MMYLSIVIVYNSNHYTKKNKCSILGKPQYTTHHS
nr:MAG TPA: hypothetical protein [Caudoviricetes sp.]